MSESNAQKPSGMLQVVLLGLVFAVPLLIAAWMYFGGEGLQPAGRTNHGILMEPFDNLRDIAPRDANRVLPADKWGLVYVNEGSCGEPCRYALYTMRQSRLMLGNDMSRLQRVFLHGDQAPDAEFVGEEHAGLVMKPAAALGRELSGRIPAGSPPGGFFLVDPLGNLVMYFPPDIDPGAMVDDIDHLFGLSSIG